MLTTKPLLALFAIAAGGFLNAGAGLSGVATGQTGPCAGAPAIADATIVTAAARMQQASEQAVLAQIQRDLQDRGAKIRLDNLHFSRASERSVEGSGAGVALFDSVNPIPIRVTVSYDLSTERVERANYVVSEGAAAAPSKSAVLGRKLRDSISDRIGARLVLEFAQQPVDFSLLQITNIASGRNRIVVTGNGITGFPGEGAAYTKFVATVDKFTGDIVNVDYELLQEVTAPVRESLTAMN